MSKMKGVVLAAGKGTRLYPLTKCIPKVLLPVYDEPMIHFALDFMKRSKVDEVAIVISREDEVLMKKILDDGFDYGLEIEYFIQEEANGTAGALKAAASFIKNEDVLLYYGDNVLLGRDIDNLIEEGKANLEKGFASLLAYEVENPSSYGVLEIDAESKIVSLEEKPVVPKSSLIAPGIYFYPKDVVDKLEEIDLSPRGEYEMTDVNDLYLKESRLLAIKVPSTVVWYDTGNADVLLQAANDYKKMKGEEWFTHEKDNTK